MNTNQITNRAIYFQVKDLVNLAEPERFRERFSLIQHAYGANKVYLEVYRHGQTLEASMFESFASFFAEQGLTVSTGLTTDEPENNAGGFDTLCYTDPESKEILRQAILAAAVLSDELLIDDFFFTNCRCPRCIEAKGSGTWAAFRTALMDEMLETVILPAGRQANPGLKIALKLPNWYPHYHELGYSMKLATKHQLAVYVGAETRNPSYTQQHLPKYLSYFITRLIRQMGPETTGSWVDPYEITANWTWFAQQIEFTALAKVPELALFSLGDLLQPENKLAFPIAGETIRCLDHYLPALGTPTGLASYLPDASSGENYIHGYLAACGIPLEPKISWPDSDPQVFLTAACAKDPVILDRIRDKLLLGHDVILTSGFLEQVQGEDFTSRFGAIAMSSRTITSKRYAYSHNGVTFAGICESSIAATYPEVTYATNDCWPILSILGENSSIPLLLKMEYGLGNLYIWTMPHDFGHLPLLPNKIQDELRLICASQDAPVILEDSQQVLLFTYDNDHIVLHSLAAWTQSIRLLLRHGYKSIENLETGELIVGVRHGTSNDLSVTLKPAVNMVYKLI